jgi:hypothetical protein
MAPRTRRFTFPAQNDLLVYWKYLSKEEYYINFLYQTSFTLGTLGDLKINLHGTDNDADYINIGAVLEKIKILEVKINARLEACGHGPMGKSPRRSSRHSGWRGAHSKLSVHWPPVP